MEVNAQDVERIVKQVLQNIIPKEEEVKTYRPAVTKVVKAPQADENGVFETIHDAVEAAYEAGKIYRKNFQLKDREKIITHIRERMTEEAEQLARMAVEETHLGRIADKIQKNLLVIQKTPGTECLTTQALSGDDGLTLVEHAPYGVIGAITPVTNPTETIINNTISMLAAGNTVVFNVHPSAKKCCAHTLKLIAPPPSPIYEASDIAVR